MNAAPSIDALLARVPQLGEHTVAPPALVPLPQMHTIEREVRASIVTAPNDARGYALLGNILTRRSLYVPARDAYRRALELDPGFAQAHLAAAELSSIIRDDDGARDHLRDALALRRRYDDPLAVAARLPLLLLLKDAPYAVNAPLELVLDRSRVAFHKYYIGEEPDEDVPEHAVAFVAFGVTGRDDPAAKRARRLLEDGVRAINHPDQLYRCAREQLAGTFDGIRGIKAVTTRSVSREQAGAIELPALVRPAGTHAGYGLSYLESRVQLEEHLRRFPSDAYDVSNFAEYRSSDGYYRKYRMIVVDGVGYPYHLAVSPRWIVHYQSSPMEEHAWMRDEERAFLADPSRVFPRWREIAERVARASGLDYVGLDVARLGDGTMLVFEADPAMLVHDEDEGGAFAYKRSAVAAIRSSLHRLIESRAR